MKPARPTSDRIRHPGNAVMQLHFSPTSPYVRKCLAVAVEGGLVDRLQLVLAAPHPVNRDAKLIASNPLGKIPTLVTDDGQILYDSRVIAEYLDGLAGAGLFPAPGAARWRALTDQSLADGLLDAALLVRYELLIRPEGERSADWLAGQRDKLATSLASLERQAPGLAGRVDIGTLAIGCALWYLDLRFAELDWRASHPQLAAWQAGFGQRESMKREWTA